MALSGYQIHVVARVEPEEDSALTDEQIYDTAREVRDLLAYELEADVNLVIESTNRPKNGGPQEALLKALQGGQAQVLGSHDGHGQGGGGQYL